MITTTKVSEGGGAYYLQGTVDLNDTQKRGELLSPSFRQEMQPYWFGTVAERFGLTQTAFQGQDFYQALQGKNPRTGALMRRQAGKNRVIKQQGQAKTLNPTGGWDFTFSPPKAFSTLWAISPKPLRQELEVIHRRCIQETLRQVEADVGFTRTGAGGKDLETVQCLWAVFPHSASRTLDPQLHHHAVLINWGIRPDGQGGAIHAMPWFRPKENSRATWNQVYLQALTTQLSQHCGVVIEPLKDDQGQLVNFAIKGLPTDLTEYFSKRKEQLRAEAGENPTAKQLQRAALSTRPAKTQEEPFSQEQFDYFRKLAKLMFQTTWDQVVSTAKVAEIESLRVTPVPVYPDVKQITSDSPTTSEPETQVQTQATAPVQATPFPIAEEVAPLPEPIAISPPPPLSSPPPTTQPLSPSTEGQLAAPTLPVAMNNNDDPKTQRTTFETLNQGRENWLETHKAERTATQEQTSSHLDQIQQQCRADLHRTYKLFQDHKIVISIYSNQGQPNGEVRVVVESLKPEPTASRSQSKPVPSDPPLPKPEQLSQRFQEAQTESKAHSKSFTFSDPGSGKVKGYGPDHPDVEAMAQGFTFSDRGSRKINGYGPGTPKSQIRSQGSTFSDRGSRKAKGSGPKTNPKPEQAHSAQPRSSKLQSTARSIRAGSRFLYEGLCDGINRMRVRRVERAHNLHYRNRLSIELAYATHQISMSEKIRCYRYHGLDQRKPHKPVHGFPKSRLMIELQALTGYITAKDRQYLLERQIAQPKRMGLEKAERAEQMVQAREAQRRQKAAEPKAKAKSQTKQGQSKPQQKPKKHRRRR